MAGGIPIKRFNWVSTQSAWEDALAWRERRRIMREDFEEASAAINNSLWSAQTTLSDGLAQIAAETAATRLESTIGAKLDTFV